MNPTLDAVLRRIDSEAYGLRVSIEECIREGQSGGETQTRLVHCYNTLVILRQKLTPEGLEVIKDWDNSGLKATLRLSVEKNADGTLCLNYFE